MEFIRKTLPMIIKEMTSRISRHNLTLFSSSISYYSALALAPFMLIILWVASLLGQNVHTKLIAHAEEAFSEEIALMLDLIFQNLNEGVNIGSISGIIGLLILLWSCSLVFLQFRHAFDVIYGNFIPRFERKTWKTMVERLFAMFVVLASAALIIASFSIVAVMEILVGPETRGIISYRGVVILLNFFIYLILFILIHYLTPTRRPKKIDAVRTAAMSSVFFILGNVLFASYINTFARQSIYGATGTFLVFLIWAYYSAFTLFLSVEVFEQYREMKANRRF